MLELFALVQVGRGLWGELGAEHLAKYEKLLGNIAKREQQAQEALAAGDQAAADTALKVAANLKKVAANAKEQADLAANEAVTILLVGLALLLVFKLIEGFYANIAYEKQYLRWRAKPSTPSGVNQGSTLFGAALLILIWPLTLFRFTVSESRRQAVGDVSAAGFRSRSFRSRRSILPQWATWLGWWVRLVGDPTSVMSLTALHAAIQLCA